MTMVGVSFAEWGVLGPREVKGKSRAARGVTEWVYCEAKPCHVTVVHWMPTENLVIGMQSAIWSWQPCV